MNLNGKYAILPHIKQIIQTVVNIWISYSSQFQQQVTQELSKLPFNAWHNAIWTSFMLGFCLSVGNWITSAETTRTSRHPNRSALTAKWIYVCPLQRPIVTWITRKFTRRASKRCYVLFAAVWREPGVMIRRVLFGAGWREPGVVCYHI